MHTKWNEILPKEPEQMLGPRRDWDKGFGFFSFRGGFAGPVGWKTTPLASGNANCRVRMLLQIQNDNGDAPLHTDPTNRAVNLVATWGDTNHRPHVPPIPPTTPDSSPKNTITLLEWTSRSHLH